MNLMPYELEKLSLNKNDIVIGKFTEEGSTEQMEELADLLKYAMKDSSNDNTVIVLQKGIELNTLSDIELKSFGLKRIVND